MAESIRHHKDWIQSCTDSPVLVYEDQGSPSSFGELVVYSVDLGTEDRRVVRCLLSKRRKVLEKEKAVIFLWPIETEWFGKVRGRPMLEAFLRTDRKAVVVSGPESESGVIQVKHIAGEIFVVQVSSVNRLRSYLVFGNRGDVNFLSDGDVQIANRKELIFRVDERKAYFKQGGAFWYDALIDRDGNIVAIVTLNFGSSTVCMSRHRLDRVSRLDLSRVEEGQVCFRERGTRRPGSG